MVRSCDTLTTEAFDKPPLDLLSRTLPGASDKAKLEVMTATRTVEILLSLNALD